MTSFNKIIIFVLLFSAAFGQSLSEKPRKPFMNTDDISKYINYTKGASIEDGGSGAFYIYLKKNK